MEWQLQDAKNQFSKVVEKARTEGPQVVTRRGQQTAVVLSIEDYNALKADRPNFVDDLLAGPIWDDALVDAIEARPEWPRRDVAL
jgi:prevent-host-death family protein